MLPGPRWPLGGLRKHLVLDNRSMIKPHSHNRDLDLASACQHAAEALSALIGGVDSSELISPALCEAADTAVLRMLAIARNLRAS